MVSPQLPLPLEPRRPDRFDDFVISENGNALAAVQQLLHEPAGVLFLSGPPVSGKSHLLNALCNEARAAAMGAFYIALKRLPREAAASLEGLQALELVCVDDIDAIAGDRAWEEALFRCFNAVRASSGRLLISSSKPLKAIEFLLPDLSSRLSWGVRQNLAVPDDDGKLEILRQRARALRIEVPGDVQAYLLKHGKRDLRSLLETLEKIKDTAFVEKRRITVPLARQVICG